MRIKLGAEVKVVYMQTSGYGPQVHWGHVKSIDVVAGTAQVELFALHINKVPYTTWNRPNKTVKVFLPGHGLKRARAGSPNWAFYRAGKYYVEALHSV